MKYAIPIIPIGIWCCAATVVAQPVPPLINYQGRLANADGSPFPTADYELRVSLYDGATNGNLVWGPQVFDGAPGTGHGPRLPVIQGYYNLMLGPVDTGGRSILGAFSSSDRFVEVTVSNRPAVLPRQQILPAPFAVQAANGAPPGAMMAYGGDTPPAGWFLCNGELKLIAAYPTLYAALGARWGAPTATHFHLPDLRGRTVFGAGAGPGLADRAVGTLFGAESKTLTTAEIPSHEHKMFRSEDANQQLSPDNYATVQGWAAVVPLPNVDFQYKIVGHGSVADFGRTAPAGGGQAFSVMNPGAAVNYIIKY